MISEKHLGAMDDDDISTSTIYIMKLLMPLPGRQDCCTVMCQTSGNVKSWPTVLMCTPGHF